MTDYIYRQDQEDPAVYISWSDKDGNLIDFSTGYTFEVKLAVDATTAPVLVKTTGITGAATSPNITITWASGDLNVTPGTYRLYLKATTSSRDRRYKNNEEPKVVIVATPADAA